MIVKSGLKDSVGADISDQDILEVPLNGNRYIVKHGEYVGESDHGWKEKQYGWYIESIGGGNCERLYGITHMVVVIGNSDDNPELLSNAL